MTIGKERRAAQRRKYTLEEVMQDEGKADWTLENQRKWHAEQVLVHDFSNSIESQFDFTTKEDHVAYLKNKLKRIDVKLSGANP